MPETKFNCSCARVICGTGGSPVGLPVAGVDAGTEDAGWDACPVGLKESDGDPAGVEEGIINVAFPDTADDVGNEGALKTDGLG